MTYQIVLSRADTLIRLMNDLISIHSEMITHMHRKLDAIKRADSDQMQSITAREMLLADRVAEREGLRKQVTKQILEGLKRDTGQYRTIRLTQLA